jgi:cob(I)alamin adenosyltransferase
MLSVSTKTGDQGSSSLANGERIPKDSLIFEVLGTQDELNSWLGVCIAKMSDNFLTEKEFLYQVQDTLFYIGAELARSPKARLTNEALALLEHHSDNLQKEMEDGWTTKFIYPGGNETAAFIDIARTISRKFERLVVGYSKHEEVSSVIFQYVNRLSDYLFVLRCFVNSKEQYKEHTFLSNKK